MRRQTEIVGMRELERTISQLEQLPQKVVTKSARKGMNIALKAVRRNAPEDTGNLKRGFKLVGERSKVKGRKIYQVVPDRGFNHVFQKPIPDPEAEHPRGKGIYGGKNDTAYYPASQEYGFLTANGYVPGYHFMRKSMDDNAGNISETTIRVMTDEIDKIR
jgi:HK97 gp10 family phage protein